MSKHTENINEGIINLSRALNFVGASTIHKAKQAQTNVLNIKGIIIDSPALPGIINTKRVIPKYAEINPPKAEHKILNNPIFLPFSSGIERCLYTFISDIYIVLDDFDNYN